MRLESRNGRPLSLMGYCWLLYFVPNCCTPLRARGSTLLQSVYNSLLFLDRFFALQVGIDACPRFPSFAAGAVSSATRQYADASRAVGAKVTHRRSVELPSLRGLEPALNRSTIAHLKLRRLDKLSRPLRFEAKR
jgi:hypothetical protein